jgi:hypothetical protein
MKGREVLSQRAAAADHRMSADPDVLMDAGQTADDRVVANRDMARQTRCVRHDQ